MLNSADRVPKGTCVDVFSENLDNCIGESGKTKHLIEARWQKLQSFSQLVILFLRAETF